MPSLAVILTASAALGRLREPAAAAQVGAIPAPSALPHRSPVWCSDLGDIIHTAKPNDKLLPWSSFDGPATPEEVCARFPGVIRQIMTCSSIMTPSQFQDYFELMTQEQVAVHLLSLDCQTHRTTIQERQANS